MLLLACVTPETPPVTDVAPVALTSSWSGATSAEVEAALAMAPDWLRNDLRLSFQQQSPERADELAATLVGVTDMALVDEVAFAMAHLSPESLAADEFYPQILVENAALIYEVDPLLDYVELVELGDAENPRTTTRYLVEVEGQIQTVELDPELYYWFIVHPRMEDEHVWYVDPWSECGRRSLECAATPETGSFWRRFLWDGAVESCPEGQVCPVLADYVQNTPVLYGAADGNDAIHSIAGMMLDSPGESRWFSFGAHGERSIQPNRIYSLGRGNCGEWGDMTTALSRTALIPNVNMTPSSWDHTWNAFYLERWVQWEPVNWAFDVHYSSGYATWGTRGDTSIWYQSQDYTAETSTLEVQVRDAAGRPVDGAIVALWSPYESSYWYAGELPTDTTGTARFLLGANKTYAYFVSDALGDYPGNNTIDLATSGIAADQVGQVTVKLDGSRPAAYAPTVVQTAAGEGQFSAQIQAEGRLLGLSYRLGEGSAQPVTAPVLSTWWMTEDDYSNFVAGESPQVQSTTLSAALSVEAPVVLVVGNFDAEATAAVGELSFAAVVPGTTGTDGSLPLSLLPGEHVAVRIAR